jgi:alpha-glucosidase/alpha-D-xyloside xylohydrolase
LLVAPVLAPGARRRTTYLPAGLWWDFWTNATIEGGREVTREVDLETLPLYVRAGAVLPIGPIKQYAQEASSEPLTFRVYPGADGTMSLYEDDGTSFRYQQGAFRSTSCSWNDQARTLTLKPGPLGEQPTGETVSIELAGMPGSKRTTRLTGGPTSVRF